MMVYACVCMGVERAKMEMEEEERSLVAGGW